MMFMVVKDVRNVMKSKQEYMDKIKAMLAAERVHKRLKHDPTRGYMLERLGKDLPRPVERGLPNIGPGPSAVWLSKDPQER